MRCNPRPGRLTRANVAAAHRRREESYLATLERLHEWPQGMPACSAIGLHIGYFVGLERRGFAVRLERDRLGDLRFQLTDAGRAPDAPEKLKRMLAE